MNGNLSQMKFSGNSLINNIGRLTGRGGKEVGWIIVKAKHWQLTN